MNFLKISPKRALLRINEKMFGITQDFLISTEPQDYAHASDEEIVLFDQVKERVLANPYDVEALIELGFLCIEPVHDAYQALGALNRAVILVSDNIQAYFWLAKTLYHDHCNEKDTKIVLEAALRVDANNAECCSLLVSVLHYLDEDKDLTRSIDLLQRAVKTQPSWLKPRFSLVCRFLEKKRFDEAEKILLEAKEIVKNTIFSPLKTLMEEYYIQCITGLNDKAEALESIDTFLQSIAKDRAAANQAKKTA
jgi:cytochrome c-type biogenesis protein CcmH/NrfG